MRRRPSNPSNRSRLINDSILGRSLIQILSSRAQPALIFPNRSLENELQVHVEAVNNGQAIGSKNRRFKHIG